MTFPDKAFGVVRAEIPLKPLKGIFVLDDDARQMIYSPAEVRDLERQVEFVAPPQTRQSILTRDSVLADVDVIFSGWGGPQLSEAFLQSAPKLKAMFYGAGSLAGILTDAAWARDLIVTTAVAANAVPVAEYALAAILFSLKHGWRLARQVRETHSYPERNSVPGNYRSTVGLISLGAVARSLISMLRPFDLNVLVYDPFMTADEAHALGVTPVSLEDAFACSDAVSLHTPSLPETEGLITGRHLSAMKPGSTFINTARAEVVRQDELIAVAESRPDLQFVLDVATPEPPEPSSPLCTLPNVVLTPHIAGSAGAECRRMGRYMVEELQRYIAGEPLLWAVTSDSVWNTCHRPVHQRNSQLSNQVKRGEKATAVASI